MTSIRDGAKPSITWPREFDPAHSPVFVSNTLESTASPSAVWAWLIRASTWPSWYPNSHNVSLAGGAKDLSPGITFRWSTFGVGLVSHVEEFVPETRIAWNGKTLGVWAYHAWLITPRDGGGCTILTEETQHGVVARIGHFLMPNSMKKGHDVWLRELDRVARSGMP